MTFQSCKHSSSIPKLSVNNITRLASKKKKDVVGYCDMRVSRDTILILPFMQMLGKLKLIHTPFSDFLKQVSNTDGNGYENVT